MLGTQAPYFYRFKLGNAEGTVVSDGPLPLGDPHKNSSASPLPRWTSSYRQFLPLENAVLEQNALVLNTGDRLILFNTASAACRSSARPPEN